jgi:hypothetical protein
VPCAAGLDFAIDIISGLPPFCKHLAASLAVLVGRFSGYIFAKIFINFSPPSLFLPLSSNPVCAFFIHYQSCFFLTGSPVLSLARKNLLFFFGAKLVLMSGYRAESNSLA